MKKTLSIIVLSLLYYLPLMAQTERDTSGTTVFASGTGISLRADVMKDFVLLQASIGPQDQADYFEVHRSTDGISYNLIKSELPEAREDLNGFSFYDREPLPGKNFYRVYAIDRETGEKRSADLLAMFKGQPRSVKPTVIVNGHQMRVEHYDGEELHLLVYTSSGTPVHQEIINSSTINLPGNVMSSGVYVYRLFDRNKMAIASGQFVWTR